MSRVDTVRLAEQIVEQRSYVTCDDLVYVLYANGYWPKSTNVRNLRRVLACRHNWFHIYKGLATVTFSPTCSREAAKAMVRRINASIIEDSLARIDEIVRENRAKDRRGYTLIERYIHRAAQVCGVVRGYRWTA